MLTVIQAISLFISFFAITNLHDLTSFKDVKLSWLILAIILKGELTKEPTYIIFYN